MERAHCIGCGCHDFAACWDENTGEPCHWLAVDRTDGTGVCSCCPDHLVRYQSGDRSSAVPLNCLTNPRKVSLKP